MSLHLPFLFYFSFSQGDAKTFDLNPIIIFDDLKATLLNLIVSNQRAIALLNERLPEKSKNASAMTEGDYDRIGVAKVRKPYDLEWIENFPEFKTHLFNELTKLLTNILSLMNKPSDEMEVRPYLDPFFIDIGDHMGGSLSKGVKYFLNFEIRSNIIDTWRVTGKIDQVMYARGTNFPILPIEAKSLHLDLIDGYHPAVAQAMSGVNAMRERLRRFANYSPLHSCGILTNGSEWILLRIDLKNHEPLYYQDPAISAFEKDAYGTPHISESGQTSIFRLLIHALGVAERQMKDLQEIPDQATHSIGDNRKPDGNGGRGKPRGKGKKKKDQKTKNLDPKENSQSIQSNHICENQEWSGPALSRRNLNRCGINEMRSIQRLDGLNRDRFVM